jgi:ubiquitin carboxyl-terminal hydrolase L3
MSRLLESSVPLEPQDRALVLEESAELEAAYKTVATEGDSAAPDDPEEEVDFHYVCFVKSHKNGHLYELDGERKGPVDHGPMKASEDVLGETGLKIIKEFIEREQGQNAGFSLLALTPE